MCGLCRCTAGTCEVPLRADPRVGLLFAECAGLVQKGPGPRGEAGIRGDRSRPNDVRGGAAGPGRRLRSFRGVCPPAARWEARADGGGGVASLTRSPPCLPGPGVRLQPALLSRPPSALPGAPTSGAGRRGGQEPKPTPGKNLELGGDQSFSQAPTKDAAWPLGGRRGLHTWRWPHGLRHAKPRACAGR